MNALRGRISGKQVKRLFPCLAAFLLAVTVIIAGYSMAAAAAPAKKVAFPAKGKVITLIVPFIAGGNTDISARNLAVPLEKALGVRVNVVNMPGAGGQLGLTKAQQEKPDGYTIFYANLPGPICFYLNPERKTAFHSKKDFTFLGMQLVDPGAICVRYDGPYKTVADLVNAAKANPGKIIAATNGILSDDHLEIIDVENTAGVKFAIVHFDSGAERDIQLIGGKIDASFGNCGSFFPSHRNKKLRIIGIMDPKRWDLLPDIPTVEEQGYKIYGANGRSLYAPPGLDPRIQKILADAIKKSVNDPEHMKKMYDAGQVVRYMSPEETEKYWDRVEATVTPIFKKAYAESKK